MSSQRFGKDRGLQAPGPAHYNPKIGMADDGRYYLSNFNSSKCRSFPHDMRRTGSVGTFTKTPGPGSYRLPSEFG